MSILDWLKGYNKMKHLILLPKYLAFLESLQVYHFLKGSYLFQQ